MIPVLPLLAQIPAAISGIASIFGWDEAEDVAAKVDQVVRGVLPAPTSEQTEKLAQLAAANKPELERLLNERLKNEQDFFVAMDKRSGDYNKTALQSGDEYVRRTRPKILRDLFKVIAAQALLYPGAVVALAYLVDTTVLKLAMTMFQEIFLYTSGIFTVGFTGYSALRTVDKQNGSGGEKGGAGLMGIAASLIGKSK